MASVNPIRYRGYYYDTETGFYYLQSRYYDPQTGRFINSDDPSFLGADGDLQSYNLYIYCLDNPVNRLDENGHFSWAAFAIGSIVGGFIGGASAAIKGGNAKDVLIAAVVWAVSGGISTVHAIGTVAAGVINRAYTYYSEKTGTKKQRFVKGAVSCILTIAGSSVGSGLTESLGKKATLDFAIGHIVTDMNIGSATSIISEAGQSMISEPVASSVINYARMMGKTLYKLEGIA